MPYELGAETAMPQATDASVREVVKLARTELQLLLEQRAAVIRRIAMLKQTLVGLASIFGDKILNEELAEIIGCNQRKSAVNDADWRAVL